MLTEYHIKTRRGKRVEELAIETRFKPRRNMWIMAIGCGFSSLYYQCFVPHSERYGDHYADYEKAHDILVERVVRVHRLAVDESKVKSCTCTCGDYPDCVDCVHCTCYEHDSDNLSYTESGKAYFPGQLEMRDLFVVEEVLR